MRVPKANWLYLVWFGIGLIPCLRHMQYRNALTFNRGDLVAFFPSLVLIGVIKTFIDSNYAGFAVVICLPLFSSFRRRLPSVDVAWLVLIEINRRPNRGLREPSATSSFSVLSRGGQK